MVGEYGYLNLWICKLASGGSVSPFALKSVTSEYPALGNAKILGGRCCAELGLRAMFCLSVKVEMLTTVSNDELEL